MAKLSAVVKNEKRKKTVAKYETKRRELKRIIRDPKSTDEARTSAMLKLQAMPRDASPTRVRNRCVITGRPRGYYRKFGLSRVALRELALSGQVPGVTKSSW